MSNYFAKTTEEVLENVQATTSGLSYREAKTRLEQNGKNALTEKKKKSNFVKFLQQFKEILIIVLLISSVVSVVIGIIQ